MTQHTGEQRKCPARENPPRSHMLDLKKIHPLKSKTCGQGWKGQGVLESPKCQEQPGSEYVESWSLYAEPG